MLNTPKHIVDANIANNVLLFPWDECEVMDAYAPADPQLQDRLSKVSFRANVAFCLACAEWLVHRFDLVSDDEMPLLYIEAAWAGNVHTAYCRYMELDDSQWHGLSRGPMNLALTMIVDMLWGGEEQPAGLYGAWMSNLVMLVLSDTAAFLSWREKALLRLEQHFLPPLDDPDDIFEENDMRGDYVPREVFDVDVGFDPANTHALYDRFLMGLNYQYNHCLYPPDEVLEFDHFDDSPYRMPKEAL